MKTSAARPRIIVTVVLMAVAAGLVGCASGAGAGGVRARAHTTRTFAGYVPWNSAVLERDGRTLHLLADWDHLQGFACDSPHERMRVRQIADAVVITVSGYAEPLPAGVSCGGVGYGMQAKTVHLSEPLRSRRLVDGGLRTDRRVLLDSDVVTAHAVPRGYRPQPMTWENEGTQEHTATREWVESSWSRKHEATFLQLTVGLPTTYYTFVGPRGPTIGTTTIGGAPARISRSRSGPQTVTTVRWTRAGGQQIELEAFGSSTTSLSVAALEAVARSVS